MTTDPVPTVKVASFPPDAIERVAYYLAQGFDDDPLPTARTLARLARVCRAAYRAAVMNLVKCSAALRVSRFTETTLSRAAFELAYLDADRDIVSLAPLAVTFMAKSGEATSGLSHGGAGTSFDGTVVPATWIRKLTVYAGTQADTDNDALDYVLDTENALRLPSLQELNVVCAGMSELLLSYLLQHTDINLRVKSVNLDQAHSSLRVLSDLILPNVTEFRVLLQMSAQLGGLPSMPKCRTLHINTTGLFPMNDALEQRFFSCLETVEDLVVRDFEVSGSAHVHNGGFPMGVGRSLLRANVTVPTLSRILPPSDAASSATFKGMDAFEPIGPAALTSLIVWAGNDLPLSSLTCDFACLVSLVTLTVTPKTRKYAHAALSPAHLAQLAFLPHLQILAAPVVASTTSLEATKLAAARIKGRPVFRALRSVRSSTGFLDVVHGARLPAVTIIEISAAHNAKMDVRVPHAPCLLRFVIRAGRTADEQYIRFGPGFTEIRVPKLIAEDSVTRQRAPLLKNVEVVWTVEWDPNAIKLAEAE
ncbi:hypothetical protein AMAG_06030 [Allomyces macrogynus ATCC 38327]|uniref:Uncharacterized protein n=1 Tax=Allomyces macrogynus (strain ATCC 38327) TaxID=578462 RepID=A0A0L0SDZ6_ALLM3|nr:hypothetical protein AMAG_06030 [Allomyces macrogynus ATCC 38327]|eukprot:KNE60657.1 hypothetical protein AMAG_06030 [Allomyces macrogynus ATCC 38327]